MTYLYPAIDPARALVLASSPNETVADFSPMLKLADSLLKLARFTIVTFDATSTWTSNLKIKQENCIINA
jgi:hypothetical protein